MEEDLNILANGRRPNYFGKWKTTSIFCQIEDSLNILVVKRQWNTTPIFCQIEDNINFWKIEGNLNILDYGR